MIIDESITIIGGGNIGTQFACTCASKGYKVNIYSSKPEKYTGELTIVDSEKNVIRKGKINKVSSCLGEAIGDSKIIFVIHPAYMFASDAKQLLPFIKPGMAIAAIPGTGGAEFAFKKCIERGAVLFGLQRVPSVARLVEYGKTVCCEGYRDKLYLASIPATEGKSLAEFITGLFDIPCEPLKNYLSVTMTPSNPILHTTRLATMFADYEEGKVYEKNPLFYGEWTDESSERLLECDAEHQNMLRLLDEMDLTAVKSLVEHYDNSDTPEKLTRKMQSIKSLHNLTSPMKKVEHGWIPDFESRYFTADFPYGLAIIEEIGELLGADIPQIRKTMSWYREKTGNCNRLELKEFGIKSKEDIYEFYK